MKVCVTGGTGSLGTALVRRFLAEGAARVVVLSRDEMKQAAMMEAIDHPNLRCFLGDVRDRNRLVDGFYGCDTIVHAAALKRVDAGAYNPQEIRKTNIQGSANVLSAALEAGIGRVLMISSDKACMPTNVYGASKAMMEHEAVAFNALSVPRGTRVSVARYGNVLGSRGSVVHTWRTAARQGKALQLTSGQMTRFWLTLDDAAGVVLDALHRMEGGEIFVPILPAMAMIDLVQAIAPGADLKIVGLRPGGEKLHEMLVNDEESQRLTAAGNLMWAIVPHLHPWREKGWPPLLKAPEAYTSEAAPRLGVEEMKKMLEGVA